MSSVVNLKLFLILSLQTSSGKPSNTAERHHNRSKSDCRLKYQYGSEAGRCVTRCMAALSAEITVCQGSRAKAV